MIDQYHIKCNCGKIFSIGTFIELPNNVCAKHICPNCRVEILTWIEKKIWKEKEIENQIGYICQNQVQAK